MAWNDTLTAIHPNNKVIASAVISEIVGSVLGQFGPMLTKSAAPPLYSKLTNTVANNIMRPNMEDMEPIMEDMFRSEETAKQWAEARSKGVEGRAQFMAKNATDLALTFPASFATSMAVKRGLDKFVFKSEAKTKDFVIGSFIEGGIHIGGIIFLPRLMPEQLGHFKTWLSNTLQSAGMKKETAETWSMNFTYSGISDIAGFSANLGYMLWALNRGGRGK